MDRDKAIAFSTPPLPESPAQVVESELRSVESRLLSLLDCRETLISEICRYLVAGGGKRIRPTFIMLVYRACGGTDARLDYAVDAAVALELIHSATLLHDDIIDSGKLRRGKPSAFSRFGLAPTLVAGDFLFSRAFELCGRFEERLIKMAADACIQLTEGEVMEARFRHQSVSLDDYKKVIELKTASLFASGGRVAADLAGSSERIVKRMGRLGTIDWAGVSDGRRPARHHGSGEQNRKTGGLRSARRHSVVAGGAGYRALGRIARTVPKRQRRRRRRI